ncbi:MAG TPA: tRNA nucleotidyltransferase [Aliidiomarina sp.]|nr:tRNA nucleotidyltransferase [Aliidiomarina sp.]
MEIYLVGGAVRDALLNVDFHEHDYVVVGATAEQLLAQGFTPVGKDFPVFLHPKTQEEYALARTERKSGQGYTGFECYAQPDVTLEQDLQRRDLTVNAIAKSASGELIDPWGGINDLKLKVLRHVSPAFAEDPLRVLRAARFAARFHSLGFIIADETYALMRDLVLAGEMKALVAERVWQETAKALATQTPSEYFLVLHRCGALTELLNLASANSNLPEQINFPLLEQVTAATDELVLRYAAWVADLAVLLESRELALNCTQQYLRAPNVFLDMARLLQNTLTLLEQPQLNTDAVLAFYQASDAWRRTERFTQLQHLCKIIVPERERVDKLFLPVQNLRDIRVQTYVEQGLKGAAIGEAVKEKRRALLNAAWQSSFI